MTESEWLTATDPMPMLEFLRARASDRQLRLLACACWRVVLPFFGRWCREAVEIAEMYADGSSTREDLLRAWQRTKKPPRTAARYDGFHAARSAVHYAELYSSQAQRSGAISPVPFPIAQTVLCDLFGNPFRPVAVAPEWLTSDVLALATGIYAEKAFDRLPVLADALQDAGCNSDDLLNHLRSNGRHVRGCWALDLVLGKS
ncbi:Uncharacterized protein OS=uncultured bacterium PE=4 SV=1 [Gemmata massiliana]|uniref:SMI1/KNR4 family protein n=2 Tax=Gemmata massiliana TaxID=1210884 RepID=A0A6P2CXK8_9BACT|nr:Uncharacterized protein OS=uncultured bacterium PE=4 SV=1 [Gemmata massiliana]